MSIAIAILIFSVLILVHEFGHFIAAKLMGVRVIEFSLFMGPRLVSFKRGETRYSIKLIPVGGSCLMEGEESESGDKRALCNKTKRARALIFAAGPLVNLVFAFICVLIANACSGYQSNTVSYVEPSSPGAVASTPVAAGDRIISYDSHAIHGPMEAAIYAQDTRGKPVEIVLARNGEYYRSTFKPEAYAESYYVLGFNGEEAYGPDWNLARAVEEGAPAYLAGMRAGDRLIEVGGAKPNSREELREALAVLGGGSVEIVWEKEDGTVERGAATPRLVESQEMYETGFRFESVENPGFFAAASQAYFDSVSYVKMTLFTLKWLVTGRVGLDQLSGPVGIVSEISGVVSTDLTSDSAAGQAPITAREAFLIKLYYILRFAAVIGVNLGIMNLVPFPALDGSKLLLLGVEAVRRKAIPPDREAIISIIGLAALMALMAFTLINDIWRIFDK